MFTGFRPLRALCVVAAASFAASPASAVSLTGASSVGALVSALFGDLTGQTITAQQLSHNSGVTGGAVAFQAGTVTNSVGTYGLPSRGIAFSTGNVLDYGAGDNVNPFLVTRYDIAATPAQEDLLRPITGSARQFDAVQIDIKFDAAPNVLGISFFTITA